MLGDKSALQNLNHRQIVDCAVELYKNNINKKSGQNIPNKNKDNEKIEIVNKLKEEVDVLKELCKETQAKDCAIQK